MADTRARDLFKKAADLQPADRRSFLAGACGGDAALYAEVEQLLEVLADASPTLTHTGWLETTGVRDSALKPDRFIAGSRLSSRYRIVTRVGKGGMGDVYKAEDLTLKQIVALKFLPEALASERALIQFRDEVRTARQVSHPNVCRVYDLGEADGLHFITMEFIDGEDLASLLRRIKRVPSETAIELARQICAGLGAAHTAGVLHRDLKPANVMIDGRGRARLTDFGIAAILRDVQSAEGLGTPAYMAPEQFAGEPASVRSDIYALGLLLYELFTGRRAIDATS